MAHYRRMQIGDNTYWYNIGKTYIEIRSNKDKQIVRKSDVGFRKNGFTCRGVPAPLSDKVVVTPQMIRGFIERGHLGVGGVEKYFPKCSGTVCQGTNRQLVADPFDLEVRNKVRYTLMCSNCYHERRLDI